jgi:hypothetical protein
VVRHAFRDLQSKAMNAATLFSGVREMKKSPVRPHRRTLLVAAAGLLALFFGGSASADTVTFNTFVTGTNINAAVGQTNVIGFTYAGNEFVGSLYFGGNNLQLFSTDLSGGNVQKFGTPMSNGFGGEVVLAASLGLGGFPTGDIYAGAGTQIFHYANSGGSPTLFATVPDGATVRQIFFDPGNSFGGNMLVATTSGHIYKITSGGLIGLVASIGADTEGLDIATSAWGAFAGDLLTASEGTQLLHIVSPAGVVTTVKDSLGNDIHVPEAETISFVPLDLDPTNSLQGFYVANFDRNIQFAGASQFINHLGDAVITSEDGTSGSRVWDLTLNPDGTSFTLTQFSGGLPNQSEDGIFVSFQRQTDLLGPAITTTPEPGTVFLLATGGIGLLGYLRRRGRRGG